MQISKSRRSSLTSVKLKYTVQVLSMEDEQAKLIILQKLHLYTSLKIVSVHYCPEPANFNWCVKHRPTR